MVPTYGAGRINWILYFLSFQKKARKREQPVSMHLRTGLSLEEGLEFLPFFREGKRYPDYPVNPV